MNAQERLRTLIDDEIAALRSSIPLAREEAVIEVVRSLDGHAVSGLEGTGPDIVTGRAVPDPGSNRALQLCLGAGAVARGQERDPGGWAARFLERCNRAADMESVLAHCESGFMRLAEDGEGTFDAWITTKVIPASWRERDDIDWWATWLARRHQPEIDSLQGTRGPRSPEAHKALADTCVRTMAYQLGYPARAVVGGLPVEAWREILSLLIARALRQSEREEGASPIPEATLVSEIACALDMDAPSVSRALSAFTLDEENAAWHAATPGVARAPLVRIAPDRIVLSYSGLRSEPLFFMLRELRRRDPEGYHNSAHLREVAFREDLSALFDDTRFVTSAQRLRLRHEAGNLRTDIDAAIFDRKTGTLGLFELKSQDPYARSAAALSRQRDNLLYANRQVSGVLDWIKRNGAQEILQRLDARAAKTFRAHKVYPFVLGRYLVPSGEGSQPDPRAAWGTWPAVLRWLEDRPIGGKDANPIASLHSRLASASSIVRPPAPGREIVLGDIRVRVHPSWAAYQERSNTP